MHKNIKVYIPQGAYYLLADFTSLGYKNGFKAANAILKTTSIATVPGKSFYENSKNDGNKLIRFCFAKKYDILKKACERLKSL